MSIHLFVVGEHPSSPNAGFDAIYERAKKHETNTFRVAARCTSPDALFDIVRDVVRERGAPVDVLDLLDHGGPGYIRMGDPLEPPLFSYDNPKCLITAQKLAELLRHDARVRLVGCETAVGNRGQQLLQMLAAAFGKSVVVYGTIAAIDDQGVRDFGNDGFNMEREEFLLFSSTDAALSVAPSYQERRHTLNLWRKNIGPPSIIV